MKEDLDGAQSYYKVDGESLGEKKLWLQDDYVKFIRFAQWKIHKTGEGIAGLITNHGYLDNPTFRGMRQSLMKTFNEIYIIDLHGNSLKKETSPDGSKDENVFDIRQGTAIVLMIKEKKGKGCKVYQKDIFGLREVKYNWLEKKRFRKKDYEKISPKTPWYFFIKRNTEDIEHYNNWIKLNEIFPSNNVGIVTARDDFAIDFSKATLEARIRQFRNLKFDDDFIRSAYGLKDTSTFKLKLFREKLAKDKNWENYFNIITYRPFDIRSIYYSKKVIERPIYENVRHLLKPNISICFIRQYSGNEKYSHALVTESMVDNRTFFSSKGIIQQAPLYLYPPDEEKKKTGIQALMMFEPEAEYGNKGKKPNISPQLFEQLQRAYNKKPTPEQILCYSYAVLYSTIYREKYAEFLKIDFPRIPFAAHAELFLKIANLGEELTELHLLKHKLLNKPATKYFGKGDSDKIEKPVYDEVAKRVYINESRYFDNIESEVWNYQIGGYQVMEKYLKDRAKAGRQMDDPGHYCKIATAIGKTIELQKEIDILFIKAESKVIAMQ